MKIQTIGFRLCGDSRDDLKAKSLKMLTKTTLTLAAIVLLCSAARGQVCTTPPPNMIAWYPGDGNADDIQGGNNGMLVNGTTFAPGMVDQAFSFDGVDDTVVVPHNPNQNTGTQVTIDAWVNPSSSGHGRPVVNKRNSSNQGYTFESTDPVFEGNHNGMQFQITINGTFYKLFSPAEILTNGVFRHVAATYDGVMMRIYSDGVEVANLAASGPIDAVTNPLEIGHNVVATGFHWQGLIDEVEIFNRALTQCEIQAIVDAGSAGKCKMAPTPTPTPTITPTPTPTPRPRHGSFVIGDLDAVIGMKVTFWGAQWAKSNSLSGGSAPSSFKGFANSLSPNPPVCGGSWSSDPGNSSGPPDTVPAFIQVIAASSITKVGPVITGTSSRLAVIKTDPGYGPALGQTGTGTVTAIICP